MRLSEEDERLVCFNSNCNFCLELYTPSQEEADAQGQYDAEQAMAQAEAEAEAEARARAEDDACRDEQEYHERQEPDEEPPHNEGYD
jgi:hypothetical protein